MGFSGESFSQETRIHRPEDGNLRKVGEIQYLVGSCKRYVTLLILRRTLKGPTKLGLCFWQGRLSRRFLGDQ
jgi:hypothetical protein